MSSTTQRLEVRIRELEQRLEEVAGAVKLFSGLTLDQLVAKHQSVVPPSSPSPSASTPVPTSLSSSTSADGDAAAQPDGATSTPEPIDISPLVLRALKYRKAVAAGQFTDEESDAELKEIIVEGLTDSQREQLKAWAGLE